MLQHEPGLLSDISQFQKGKGCMISFLWGAWSEVKWLSRARLCDPMDCSLPCSSVHGIFQARVLERVAISFSRGSSWPRDGTRVSHIVSRRFTVWATREVLEESKSLKKAEWWLPRAGGKRNEELSFTG